MADSPALVRVIRVLALSEWAAVVVERLGHPPETALSLAGASAGTVARVKPSHRRPRRRAHWSEQRRRPAGGA